MEKIKQGIVIFENLVDVPLTQTLKELLNCCIKPLQSIFSLIFQHTHYLWLMACSLVCAQSLGFLHSSPQSLQAQQEKTPDGYQEHFVQL